MSEGEATLQARGVGRRRGDNGWLLQEIDLTVRAGDRLAVIGPSGAGKTLLLRALALLDPLDAGEVCWNGRSVSGAAVPSFRRQVMYLHQRPALFEGTVEDNLRLPFELATSAAGAFDRDRAVELLTDFARDSSFLDKRQRDLSGGESQIVALVRTLQMAPSVLLLDEPTAALDADTVRAAEGAVQRWQRAEPRRAFLWVSHDAAQPARVADRAIRLRGGRLEGEG
jgi:putative ABC transport system ATP-binding protein